MFGEEALHEWQSNTSEKQLLHKSKKNAGKNWQNQLFSELWKIIKGLKQLKDTLFKKTQAESHSEVCNRPYDLPLIPNVQ